VCVVEREQAGTKTTTGGGDDDDTDLSGGVKVHDGIREGHEAE
jgi:hypothetical protein